MSKRPDIKRSGKGNGDQSSYLHTPRHGGAYRDRRHHGRLGTLWPSYPLFGTGTDPAGQPSGHRGTRSQSVALASPAILAANASKNCADSFLDVLRTSRLPSRSTRDAAKEAKDWLEYETRDDLFHRSVAQTSDNALLLLLFDQLNHVRRTVSETAVVRGTTRPPETHSSFAEHDRTVEAIAARDPKAAQSAMRAHIGSVSDRLFGD